jgi:hypothetical protein
MVLAFPLWVLLAAVPHKVDGADYRVELPASLAMHTERTVPTPWGDANADEYVARDERGITYIFSAYRYRSSVDLKASKLKAVKDIFLQTHKCVATTMDAVPIRTADAQTWPQTQFGGNCAAPGDYRILVLVAAGRHYQLQVSNDPQALPGASADQAVASPQRWASARELEQALIDFAAHCRFDVQAMP